MGMKRSWWANLGRAIRWHRRLLIAALAGVAALAALNVVSTRDDPGRPVLVARRLIPAGATISESDLSVTRSPPHLVPEHSLQEPVEAVGHQAVGEIPARRALVASDLLGVDGQLASGRMGLPVRFSDEAMVGLLHTGSRIDILGAEGATGNHQVIAADVRVIAVPQSDEGGLLGSRGPDLVLVEVTPAQATAITSASGLSGLSFALR